MRREKGDRRLEKEDRRREKGDRRREKGDRRLEKGDRKRKKGDRGLEKGDRRHEKGDMCEKRYIRNSDVRRHGSLVSYSENLALFNLAGEFYLFLKNANR